MFILEMREGDPQQDRSFIDLHLILVYGRKEQDQIQEQSIDLSPGMVKDFGQSPRNLDILDQGHPLWREG